MYAGAPILRRRLDMWTRRTWTSSAYSGPQTSISSARWVISRPRLTASDAQEVELDRGQVDLGAVDAHGVRGEVELEPVGASTGSDDARGGAPQRGLQPRDELARPERLGHVVVGAGLQRADLLVLLADRARARGSASATTRAALR